MQKARDLSLAFCISINVAVQSFSRMVMTATSH